jgi:hypothetical protein
VASTLRPEVPAETAGPETTEGAEEMKVVFWLAVFPISQEYDCQGIEIEETPPNSQTTLSHGVGTTPVKRQVYSLKLKEIALVKGKPTLRIWTSIPNVVAFRINPDDLRDET